MGARDRTWVAIGVALIVVLVSGPVAVALRWPREVHRATVCAFGAGVAELVVFEPAGDVPSGTRVLRAGTTVGYVVRTVAPGQALVRWMDRGGEGAIALRRIDAPAGLAWALKEIITPELIAKATELAARARLRESLVAVLARGEKRFEARFPEVYAAHAHKIEGELGRLWRERLSARADAITRDLVLPHLSRSIPLGDVAREVASGTYDSVGMRDAASAVLGDEDAQHRLKHEVGQQLAASPTLRDGLRTGATQAWADPALRAELTRSLREVIEDPELRKTTGTAVLDAFEKITPELDTELKAELATLEARGLELDDIVLGLALDATGGLHPALIQVLRRELLNKDRCALEVVAR